MHTSDLKLVEIYTDGGCSPNPGPGAWAAVLIYNGKTKELSGFESHTTNNRMEMMAAIQALEALKFPCQVKLHSDSALLINAFQKNWILNWQKKGWMISANQEVKNPELWQRLLKAAEPHQTEWVWVKGHSGVYYNERCDQLASQQIRQNAKYLAPSTAPPQSTAPPEGMVIYTIGSCDSLASKHGTWAALLTQETKKTTIWGREVAETSATRMELLAALKSLELLKEPQKVKIFVANKNIINAFNANWIESWDQKGWMKKKTEPVLHQDLWKPLYALTQIHTVSWHLYDTGTASFKEECKKLAFMARTLESCKELENFQIPPAIQEHLQKLASEQNCKQGGTQGQLLLM